MVKTMFTVILVRPEKPANLGSICRLMANFQAKELRIVDNKVDLNAKEVQITARKTYKFIDTVKHYPDLSSALSDISFSIATTARVSGPKNPLRMAFNLEHIPWNNLGQSPAFVFGQEDCGLTNEEIDLCDMVLTIPTSNEYPSLNLSHAVAIILYETYKRKVNELKSTKTKEEIKETENWRPVELASGELVERLFDQFNLFVDTFVRPYRRDVTKQIFKNVIKRANPTKREAARLLGAFSSWKFYWNKEKSGIIDQQVN